MKTLVIGNDSEAGRASLVGPFQAVSFIRKITPHLQVVPPAPRTFPEPEETSRQADVVSCVEDPLDLEPMRAAIERT